MPCLPTRRRTSGLGDCLGVNIATETKRVCATDHGRMDTERVRGGTVGFVAGCVLAVGSAVMFLRSLSGGGETPTSARMECGVGPGKVGLACGGTF